MKKISLKYIIIFFGAALLFFSNDINSQILKKNGGSVYSIFGVGDINYSMSSRSDAMGIMGIALPGTYINSLNPAMWTGIQHTTFSTGFNLDKIKSSDGTVSANRTYGNFESFNFAVPIDREHGWVFNAGLHTYSVVSYDLLSRGSSDEQTYTHAFSGEGGLSRISLGLSYTLFKVLNTGVQFNYIFGNINSENRIVWDDASLFNTDNQTDNSLFGYYFNAGLAFHGFDKLFKSKSLSNLHVGALFSTPMKMTSNISARYDRVSGADSVNITDGTLNLPLAFGFGISNEFNNNLVVSSDFYYQNWANYKYYGSHPNEFKNCYIIGAGLEWTPSRKFEDGLIKTTSYRIGGNYNSGYLTISGHSVSSFGASLGVSLRLSRLNNLDINFAYKRRGTTADGLVLDNYYRLGLGIDLGEFWFIRSSGY